MFLFKCKKQNQKGRIGLYNARVTVLRIGEKVDAGGAMVLFREISQLGPYTRIKPISITGDKADWIKKNLSEWIPTKDIIWQD